PLGLSEMLLQPVKPIGNPRIKLNRSVLTFQKLSLRANKQPANIPGNKKRLVPRILKKAPLLTVDRARQCSWRSRFLLRLSTTCCFGFRSGTFNVGHCRNRIEGNTAEQGEHHGDKVTKSAGHAVYPGF